MENLICRGKIAAVMKRRVVIEQESKYVDDDGSKLYESFIFEKWAFWEGVKRGQEVQVKVEYLGNSTIVKFEQIG